MKQDSKSLPKERNPFVLHLITKKQGPHGKSKKTIRPQDKMKIKKDYLEKIAA